jgi:hypothetical protein
MDKPISSVYNIKHQNNAYKRELGRYLLIIKIQKRAVKFYKHLKESGPQTVHNKAITYREMNLEKSPLSKLVLELFTNTNRPHRGPGQKHKQTPQRPSTETQLDPTK